MAKLLGFWVLGFAIVACGESFEPADADPDADGGADARLDADAGADTATDSGVGKTICRIASGPCDVPVSSPNCPERQPDSGVTCAVEIECVYCEGGDFFTQGDVMTCDGERFSPAGSIACAGG